MTLHVLFFIIICIFSYILVYIAQHFKWPWSLIEAIFVVVFVVVVVFNFILFLNFTILYWFCQILKWIRHRYTCVMEVKILLFIKSDYSFGKGSFLPWQKPWECEPNNSVKKFSHSCQHLQRRGPRPCVRKITNAKLPPLKKAAFIWIQRRKERDVCERGEKG